MLPPPTTIATSTPRPWTAATSRAIAWTRSGSVPYSRPPISASPESLSRTREYTGGPAPAPGASAASSADGEPGEPADDNVLSGLGGQLRAQLLDRLAAVLVLVDVPLAQQHDVVEPLLELALDDPLADVLGAIGRLLGGDPLLALPVLGRDVLLGDGQGGGGGDVQREVADELDEPLGARDEVGLAVDLDQHADPVAGVDVALHHALGRRRAGPLGGLGLPAGAEDLDRALGVAVRLGQRLAAVHDPRAGPFAEGLHVLGTHCAHVASSVGVWGVGSASPSASGVTARASAAPCSSASRRACSSASRRACSSASRRACSSASRRSRSSRAASSSASHRRRDCATAPPIARVIAAQERIASSLPGIT